MTRSKIEYHPLDAFDYMWCAPHIQAHADPISREKVERRRRWEYELYKVRGGQREIDALFRHMLENGMINPLIVHRVGDIYYPVKGNQRLCVLYAIRNLLISRAIAGPGGPNMTADEKRWAEQGFESIPCRVLDPSEPWSHDNSVTRRNPDRAVRL